MIDKLEFTCPGFFEGGEFPVKHTGRGEDLSPEFYLHNLSPNAKTVTIILEDISHPLTKHFTHWLIWNIPASTHIEGALSKGYVVPQVKDARQGIAYGWHGYAGPNPPLGQNHSYRFTIYVLDTSLELGKWTRRPQLLGEMANHILQKGQLTATFGSSKIWQPLLDPSLG